MKRFYKVLERLQRLVPPKYPVYIYIREPNKMKGLYGDCFFTGKSYSIRVAKGNQSTMIYTLLHEWAHCLDERECCKEEEFHDEEFGKCYAKVWRAYEAF